MTSSKLNDCAVGFLIRAAAEKRIAGFLRSIARLEHIELNLSIEPCRDRARENNVHMSSVANF